MLATSNGSLLLGGSGTLLLFSILTLLFFFKCIERAFKFGEPFRDKVKIYGCGLYG
jgi:hypothetical protein